MYMYIATYWNLECLFGNGALQIYTGQIAKKPKTLSGAIFFAPFSQPSLLVMEILECVAADIFII